MLYLCLYGKWIKKGCKWNVLTSDNEIFKHGWSAALFIQGWCTGRLDIAMDAMVIAKCWACPTHPHKGRREEVCRSQVVQRRQEEGTHVAVVAEGIYSGQPLVTLGSRFGFCVVNEPIQASSCVAHRPLAVLTGSAEPNPVTRSGKNKHGGLYLSHTHYKLPNSSALEVFLVNKMFHL